MLKVGFTGTRHGMSQLQKENLVLLLLEIKPTEFHHGDCVGADAEAHEIVREFLPDTKIVIHPPISDYLVARCVADEYRTPQGYIERDRTIVDSTEYLIGCPYSDVPVKRSGSWFTINYAIKQGKKYHHIKR